MDPAASGVFNVTDLSELNYQSLLIEIQKVECLVNSLASLVASEIFNREIPEYVSLKEAARLKGVTSYKNLMKKPWHQPCCGTNSVRVNGHRAWKRQDVIEWLDVTDSNLEQYARSKNVDISRHFKNGRNI